MEQWRQREVAWFKVRRNLLGVSRTVVVFMYMEFFGQLALGSASARPRLWKWYVDDICCIL